MTEITDGRYQLCLAPKARLEAVRLYREALTKDHEAPDGDKRKLARAATGPAAFCTNLPSEDLPKLMPLLVATFAGERADAPAMARLVFDYFAGETERVLRFALVDMDPRMWPSTRLAWERMRQTDTMILPSLFLPSERDHPSYVCKVLQRGRLGEIWDVYEGIALRGAAHEMRIRQSCFQLLNSGRTSTQNTQPSMPCFASYIDSDGVTNHLIVEMLHRLFAGVVLHKVTRYDGEGRYRAAGTCTCTGFDGVRLSTCTTVRHRDFYWSGSGLDLHAPVPEVTDIKGDTITIPIYQLAEIERIALAEIEAAEEEETGHHAKRRKAEIEARVGCGGGGVPL